MCICGAGLLYYLIRLLFLPADYEFLISLPGPYSIIVL